MILKQTIYCYTENNIQKLSQLIEQLKCQNAYILSLRDYLRSEEHKNVNASICTVIVRSDNETFLRMLPELCLQTGVELAIFLTNMISDECIAYLHKCTATPLFYDFSLLYKYSSMYLRSRVHLQVAYADTPIDYNAQGLIRENRIRVLLSSNPLMTKGVSTFTVTEAQVLSFKEKKPTIELPVRKPTLTSYPIAPYLAIRKEDFPFTWIRSYPSSDGVYDLISEIPEKHTEICRETNPTAERLVSALNHDFYPLIKLSSYPYPILIHGWEESSGFFHAQSLSFPCTYETLRFEAEEFLCGIISCTYLKPLPVTVVQDPTDFLKEVCLGSMHVTNAFLRDFYRTETSSENELASICTFMQERILICDLLHRDATSKGLYLPSIEDHILLIERLIRPVLQTVELGKDPFSCHYRLLMAEGFSKVLLSEERCIEAYLDEVERHRRDAEWILELRKKGNKT